MSTDELTPPFFFLFLSVPGAAKFTHDKSTTPELDSCNAEFIDERGIAEKKPKHGIDLLADSGVCLVVVLRREFSRVICDVSCGFFVL